MNSRLFSSIATLLSLAFTPANAQVAGVYEPFTHQTNADSWVIYDYLEDKYYFPAWDSAGDGQNPDIFFSFANSSALDFYADNSSSNGAFVGNLTTGGVDAIGCDIYVEDSSSFNFAEFFLYSPTTNSYYYSDFITVDSNGWSSAYASFSDESWYVYQNGSYTTIHLTPQILSDITEVGVTFYPLDVPAANGKIVALDNFTYYGAYVTPKITTSKVGNMFHLSFDRRPGIAYSILSTSNLTSWAMVPGQNSITGSTPYTMSLPLTPGSRFFKVGITDFLTSVPMMPTP